MLTSANGQKVDNLSGYYSPWIVGGRVHTGFLLCHHNNMRILSERDPYAFELYLARATGGEKPWQSFYGKPQYGVSYMLLRSGSPSYIGNVHCVYPFLHFFLTDADRRASLGLRLGTGIAYIEKIFDRVDNYKNSAIGSHINAFLGLQMEGRVRVAESLYLSAGWAYSHTSNGAFRKPNSGLNYVTAFAGASYAFGKKKIPEPPADRVNTDVDKKWHYAVYFSGGTKAFSAFDDTKYTTLGLSFEVFRPHLAFTRFMGTLDVYYDSSDHAFLNKYVEETDKLQTVKPGITAGYAFLFGKLSANVFMGTYLYTKYTDSGWIYQRLALRYAVGDRLNVHLGLKTHWGQADYVELGLGFKIR